MDLMRTVWDGIDESHKLQVGKNVVEIMDNAREQARKLQREVDRWCQERAQ